MHGTIDMRPMLLCLIFALGSPASAQTADELDATVREAYRSALLFSECAGFWDFMSMAEAATDNPASAQHMHNVSNGARLSAGYLLSMRHSLQSPAEAPRAYGSWDEFIEPRAEVTATRMMAAVERQDMREVEAQAIICRGASESSEEILDQIRSEQAY